MDELEMKPLVDAPAAGMQTLIIKASHGEIEIGRNTEDRLLIQSSHPENWSFENDRLHTIGACPPEKEGYSPFAGKATIKLPATFNGSLQVETTNSQCQRLRLQEIHGLQSIKVEGRLSYGCEIWHVQAQSIELDLGEWIPTSLCRVRTQTLVVNSQPGTNFGLLDVVAGSAAIMVPGVHCQLNDVEFDQFQWSEGDSCRMYLHGTCRGLASISASGRHTEVDIKGDFPLLKTRECSGARFIIREQEGIRVKVQKADDQPHPYVECPNCRSVLKVCGQEKESARRRKRRERWKEYLH